MPTRDVILQVRDVWKSFGGRPAVAGVTLDLHAGEIVGLVGPNGAGKSTLIKLLDGVYRPDRGTMTVVAGADIASVVGVVHQELGIIDDLTVAENVRLGVPGKRRAGIFLRRVAERRAAMAALEAVGLDVSPDVRAGSLSPGEQSLLAMARLTAKNRKILILDETTAALPSKTAAWLLGHVRALARQQGASVVFVSHRLGEVIELCDRIVVLVDGELAVDRPIEGLDQGAIADLMTRGGTRRAMRGLEAAPDVTGGDVALELRGVGAERLVDVDLALHRGEVLGVTGLVGSGLYELARVCAGVMRPTVGKRVVVDDQPVAFIPPDRRAEGLFIDLPIRWNATIGALPRYRVGGLFQNLMAEDRAATAVCDDLGVVCTSLDQPVRELSGGNQQKVLVARGLLNGAQVLVLCEPTRGVDIHTRGEIYALIDSLKRRGAAIVIFSSDLEEILAVSDRVGVMRDGELNLLDAEADPEISINELVM